MSPQEHLKAWREREGLSMAEAAALVGMPRASSWQYYEDPKGFKGQYLPAWLASLTGWTGLVGGSGNRGPSGDRHAMIEALHGIAELAAREAREATDTHYAIIFSGIAATARKAWAQSGGPIPASEFSPVPGAGQESRDKPHSDQRAVNVQPEYGTMA